MTTSASISSISAVETLSVIGNAPNGSYAALVRFDNETFWMEAHTRHDTLALVSSLYGPGTMIAWYFTMLAVALKWLLHPEKKATDSLDNDLAASLILPSVATVDFILQARALLNMQKIPQRPIYLRFTQIVRAMQAPFDVLEVFMMFGAILFLIALSHGCYRRGVAVATTILLCFTGQCYLHLSGLRTMSGLRCSRGEWSLNDLNRADPEYAPKYGSAMGILTGALPILWVLVVFVAVFALQHFQKVAMEKGKDVEEQRRVAQSKHLPGKLLNQMKQHMSTLLSLLVLLLSIVMSIGPSMERVLESEYGVPPWTIWDKLRMSMPSLVSKWLPATSSSISDLDQAVAAISGAVILAFSIYSIFYARYEAWKKEGKKKSCVDGGAELTSLQLGQGADSSLGGRSS